MNVLEDGEFKPSQWKKGDILGAGAFGSVYLAMHEETGHLIAMKQVSLDVVSPQSKESAALKKEMELLQRLRHRNVIEYYGMSSTDTHLSIYLEYASGDSLASLLRRFGGLDEQLTRGYVRQILAGLEYLHSQDVIHRDIKPANILLDEEGCVKLADFGGSTTKQYDNNATIANKTLVGTPLHMAPEVIMQTGHSCKADVWSLGITICELISGSPPWKFDNKMAGMYQIAMGKVEPTIPEVSDTCRDFLNRCLTRDVAERASVDDLLSHPWMAGVSNKAVKPIVAVGSLTSLRQSSSLISDSESVKAEHLAKTKITDSDAALSMKFDGHVRQGSNNKIVPIREDCTAEEFDAELGLRREKETEQEKEIRSLDEKYRGYLMIIIVVASMLVVVGVVLVFIFAVPSYDGPPAPSPSPPPPPPPPGVDTMVARQGVHGQGRRSKHIVRSPPSSGRSPPSTT